MASLLLKSLRKSTPFILKSCCSSSSSLSSSCIPCSTNLYKRAYPFHGYLSGAFYHGSGSPKDVAEEHQLPLPTLGEGISRPISDILKQLNKKVPDSLISLRYEDGVPIKFIPWHVVNRIMNLHAPEWSGEVRNIVYSADGKTVSVVYRVTLHGTDAEIFRESTGTAFVEGKGIGDAVQKAEAMAFRRACARLGLGLHLYHEDLS